MAIVIASTNAERCQAAADKINATGGRALAVTCDVSKRDDVTRIAEEAIAAFGAVHLVCANAGVTTMGPFIDHRPSDWDWTIDVVFRGVTNFVEIFYPRLAVQGEGHILLTGSQAGLVPNWALGHGPYVAAKSAVMALGAALRPEAASHGVGVTVLIPAATVSDIVQSSRSRPARYGQSADGPLSLSPDYPINVLPADDVARQAVAGIRRNAPFVATHPELRDLAADYFNHILQAYDRPVRG
jgi:NAD(P)-dependent dehydrogenase (short-subunit alcohol dehydrogenase family)